MHADMHAEKSVSSTKMLKDVLRPAACIFRLSMPILGAIGEEGRG